MQAYTTDSDFKWTNYGGQVEFVGGSRGREVHVRGRYVGEAKLEVVIGGRMQSAPSFTLNVVTQRLFKITAWIVENAPYNQRPIEPSMVQNMIAPLNDIYRQVGVSFYLDSVTVTNIPGACNLLYDSTTNDVWHFDRLVDISRNTGGIECYFVNDIYRADGNPGPAGANSIGGIVMSAEANVSTLAHEIGHAFGLCDVYVAAREKDEDISGVNDKDIGLNVASSEKAPDDWNDGCHGRGDSGARYYAIGTKMSSIIPRLVMYGIAKEGSFRWDITRGSVDGVWYSGEGLSRVWYDSGAGVGFFINLNRKESPCHD